MKNKLFSKCNVVEICNTVKDGVLCSVLCMIFFDYKILFEIMKKTAKLSFRLVQYTAKLIGHVTNDQNDALLKRLKLLESTMSTSRKSEYFVIKF